MNVRDEGRETPPCSSPTQLNFLPEFFKDKEELRSIWSSPDTRRKLLDGLAEKGFGQEQLLEMQKIIDAEKSDLFDVLADLGRAEEIGRIFSGFQKYLYCDSAVA